LKLLALAIVPLAVAVLPLGAGATAAGCPMDNGPDTLKVVAGSPQTAQLGTQFQTRLQVQLVSSNGCPITGQLAGISVTFAAPASGPSGTFATSASRSVVVGTDASGMATAPEFTANESAGYYNVHAASDYGSADLALSNTASGVVASIAAADQVPQTAGINSRYSRPLEAQVLDPNGSPVAGASVTFSIGTGASGAGASFLGGGPQATVKTNAAGQATSPPLVANATAGRFTASASVAGISTVVTYDLVNRAPHLRIAVAQSAETARVKTQFAEPLRVRVLDDHGRPVEGATVTFALPQAATGAGGTFVNGASQATATTDAAGRAESPTLVANGTAGRFTGTATVPGAEAVQFVLRNRPGKPSSITAGSASGQSTRTGRRFAIRPAAKVSDADGNPVAGATVTFTAPVHGPSARFGRLRTVRVQTDRDGIAVAPPLTANKTPGGYVVTASVGSVHPASFALVNTR
jgi:protocatechuate 3,4-dioxygenase beta subunit